MSVAMRAIGAALLSIGVGAIAGPAAAADCALVAKAALPLLANSAALPLAPAHINGASTWMMIDTGAVRSAVQAHVADTLQLQRVPLDSNLRSADSLTTTAPPPVIQRAGRGGGMTMMMAPPVPQINADKIALLNQEQNEAYSVYGVGGRPIREQTRGHVVKLGALDFVDASMLVIPDLPGAPAEIAGMIGMDLLRLYDIELDPADHFVNLFSPDHCAGSVVYWAKEYLRSPIDVSRDGTVTIAAVLDGQPVRALIDTGASQTLLRQNVAASRFDVTPSSPGVTEIGTTTGMDGSVLTTYAYRFRSLEIAGITFHDPELRLVPDRRPRSDRSFSVEGRSADAAPEITLGMTELRQLRLYLALREGMLYATPAAKPVGVAAVKTSN
jgi:predicted aspartyl protease